MRAQFAHFVEAGATVKAITDPPNGPGEHGRATRATRAGASGSSPTPTTRTRTSAQIIRSPLRLPQFRNTTAVHRHRRDDAGAGRGASRPRAPTYRVQLAAWMDAQGVDAVVFPGQLSRHPPQRLDPAELRPPRPAGLGRGRAER